ncbi:rare lipoprotein A [Sphingomonas zeicaulis]|uniref:septal ring lytic transglycosylase RlpA family protein n=1 Tax=Sphingomonas zeicaulis TaxID=1632740 RepID=UPI003D1AE37C
MRSGSSGAATAAVATLTLLLAGCGSTPRPTAGAGRPTGGKVVDYPVKVGAPYQVGGITYMPVDDPDYDMVGLASWYGGEFGGSPTANGERFDPGRMSAAHKTLPLPSYVEVTALDTGRTITVRVNDRGPFAGNRVIDLSQAAARALGIERSGTARVRVRRVYPSERDRAALRSGGQLAMRTDSVPARLPTAARAPTPPPQPQARSVPQPAPQPYRVPTSAPAPQQGQVPIGIPMPPPYSAPSTAMPQAAPAPAVAPLPESGGWFVQVGAFSSRERAAMIAGQLGARVSDVGALHRVRLGPYASADAARDGVAKASAAGYADAQIVQD